MAAPPVRRSLWSVTGLGAGYGSLAIKGERIYLQALNRSGSTVSSLSRADGKVEWTKALGRGGSNDRGPGPRGTPTLDGDRLYVLTENGDLACLNAANGVGDLAAQHPRRFRRPPDPVADQRVAAG